jgi:hypothetical protein
MITDFTLIFVSRTGNLGVALGWESSSDAPGAAASRRIRSVSSRISAGSFRVQSAIARAQDRVIAPAETAAPRRAARRAAASRGGAGVIRGNLTPQCAAAVLEALGKKAGPEDDRTEGKRFHDALQLA